MANELSNLKCPRCYQTTSINISEYLRDKQTTEILWQCDCGHQFKYKAERRRHNRKRVRCSGVYRYINEVELDPGVVAGKFVGQGKMTVVDLSLSGLKVKLKKKEDFKINDNFEVEFYLKDKNRTLVRETATVKNIDKKYIGGTFGSRRSQNLMLGFYLLDQT